MTRSQLNATLLAIAFALLIGLTVQAARLLAVVYAMYHNGMLP
jgi:hypothetical protein